MNNGLPEIETIIRDLGIVADAYGDPLYNSAFVLFAGKTASSAKRYMESFKAVEPVEVERNEFHCGGCNKTLDRDDRFCRKCGKKIKWNRNIRNYW